MIKTTIYLPAALKARIERIARQNRVSEAEVIRTAIERLAESYDRPRPKLPLFASGRGDIAGRADDLLAEGFGRE